MPLSTLGHLVDPKEAFNIPVKAFQHKISALSFAVVAWNIVFVEIQQQLWTFCPLYWIPDKRFHVKRHVQSIKEGRKTCISNINPL